MFTVPVHTLTPLTPPNDIKLSGERARFHCTRVLGGILISMAELLHDQLQFFRGLRSLSLRESNQLGTKSG